MLSEHATGRDDVAAPALLAVVSEPTRWRILKLLSLRGNQCVCEIEAEARVTPNLLSYHLRVLREAGLVVAERRGRWIDYGLANEASARLRAALPS